MADDYSQDYIAQRQRIGDEDLDRWAASRLASPEVPGSEILADPGGAAPKPQPGLAGEAGRGLARGSAQLAEAVGTGLKAVGVLTGSELFKEQGKLVADFWAGVAQEFPRGKRAEGNLWDNPWLAVDPYWLTAGVAETIPSLAAALVPAGGAYRAIKLGAQVYRWTPALTLKLARIGASVAGGAAGGFLEGASTYEHVKAKGGTDEQAVRAMGLMALASAGLNAISFGMILGSGANPVSRFAKAGLTEAITEYLESPTEAAILGEDMVQALKDGLNVVPAAFLTGGAAGAAVGGGAKPTAEGKVAPAPAAPSPAPVEGIPKPEPQRAPGIKLAEEPAMGEARVNLKFIQAEDSVKHVIQNVNRINAEKLAEHRKTVPHGQTVEESAGALSVEQALALPEEPVLDRKQMTALRDHVNAAGTHVDELVTRVLAGDAEARAQLLTAVTLAGELELKREAASRETARTLEAHKIPSEAARSPLDVSRIAEMIDTSRELTDVDPYTLANRLRVLRTAPQKTTFLGQVAAGIRSGQNMIYEAWINGLLSGPTTHATNFVSNTVTTFWAAGERALAPWLHTGTEAGVAKGEAAAMLRGIHESWLDALRLAKNAMLTGQQKVAGSKLELREPAITAGNMGLDPDTSFGRAVDLLGNIVRIPGRLLIAGDALFKGVNYRAELKALAFRQATSEGLQGETLTKRVMDIEANPPSSVKTAAGDFALLLTFQNELGPKLGGALSAARDLPFGRVVLPFTRTPANIGVWAVQRTPGLQFFSSTLRNDLSAGGARGDLAKARIAAGALTAGAFAALAAGGLISGGGPTDKELRRLKRMTGWQPYSVKVGDTWYSYNRLDPAGMTLGTLADFSEIAGHLPEWQAAELGVSLMLSVSRNWISKSYVEGLSNVIEAVSEPDRGARTWAQWAARSLLPFSSLLRTIEREGDPTIRETRTIMDQVRASVPGWSSMLPPTRNIFGDPVLLEGGLGPDIMSPVYTSTEKKDSVADEIVRLRVNLSMPPRTIEGRPVPVLRMGPEAAGEGIELSPQEYDLFVRLAGNELKGPDSKGMKDTLADVMQSEDYRHQTDGPEGGKALIVRSIVQSFREAARGELFNRIPELIELVEEKQTQRLRQLAPEEVGVR